MVKVRWDLQHKGLHPHLWLIPNPRRLGKFLKPTIGFVLKTSEFDVFCSTIEVIKIPSSYVSSMAKYIHRQTFGGFKSHDYHILMQQVLPLALRGLMVPSPRMTIMHICKVYKCICNKVWNLVDIDSLHLNVTITLNLLEIEFPTSFFDIMTHLALHLIEELDLCGPMATRWMSHDATWKP